MADGTKIEWTDATWNPVTGCSVVSPGCTNCYAMKLAGTRMQHHPSRAGLTDPSKAGPVWTGQVRLNEDWLDQPLRWKRPRRIFVCAHGDLFHEKVPDAWIDRVFAMMALCPQHTFQVLTKRAERMRAYLDAEREKSIWWWLAETVAGDLYDAAMYEREARFGSDHPWPLPNVWLGVSAEDQPRADERIRHLIETPAAVRFVSAEPLLGPLDLRQWLHDYGCGCGWGGQPLDYCIGCGWRGHAPGEIGEAKCPGCGEWLGDHNACPECDGHDGDGMSFGPTHGWINWVIAGGESGPGARPMHPDWARDLRDQCAAADVAYFHKQNGEWAPCPYSEDHVASDKECCVDGTWYLRVGKKAAGALLDGLEHREFPAQPTHAPPP